MMKGIETENAMSIKKRITSLTHGSQGWLWTGTVLAFVSLGFLLGIQWLIQTQAALGMILAAMLYTTWTQVLALASFGLAGAKMVHRAAPVSDSNT